MTSDGTDGGRRVLVVDDDPAMRRYLDVVLRRAGFRVDEAESGAAALASLAATPGADAVLLDAMLPDMRGFELARRLVADPATAHVPICFLTGAVHGRITATAGVACVVKPSSPAQLVAAIEGILDGTAGASAEARRAAVDRVEEMSLL